MAVGPRVLEAAGLMPSYVLFAAMCPVKSEELDEVVVRTLEGRARFEGPTGQGV